MPELESWFTELAMDVDGRGLSGAAEVRRAADLRARRRGAFTAGAAAVAAAAVGVGVVTVPASQPGPVDPTPTVPATPTPTPVPTTTPTSPVGEKPVTSVPDRAFFDLPADRRGNGWSRQPIEEDDLTRFCTDPFADDENVTARRGLHTAHFKPGTADQGYTPIGTIEQVVAAHRPGGAAAAMDRLRAEIDDCATFTVGSTTYELEVLEPPAYGDEAVHVAVNFQGRYNPDADPFPNTNQILVVRVGDTVTVLRDRAWEGGQAKPAEVRLFGQLAVDALDEWR
ncbi:hypothetical protein [Asanoa iriomotensis]|uniref:PknH-like extracellular domain-containing protein n=1 Tax=Asanoa iriomotensis TaxID=234613 RepID=A0ABQ4C162_9ACTN|nr:hypothetical protein [Asanoa iriomotensis]GIF56508.1 hypothetical protein Air01nite_26030 [Asanoa iriomotensis]